MSFVGCSDDEEETVVPPVEETSTEPVVLSYDTFYAEDDVIITSADTSTISVSKEYLETMKYRFKTDGDTIPVTIWRTIDTPPFVRNVIDAKEQGDRVVLTTVSGDLGDVLGNSDLELDTDVYVDFNQAKVATRGGTTVDNYNRYTDQDGVIHPAVIILEEEGIDGVSKAASRTTRSGKVFYTAEDIAMSNADFKIIDVNRSLGDHALTSPDKNVKLYVKDTNLKATAGVKINISTKWFKLKKFECAAYGDFGLNFTSGIEAKASIKDWSKEADIAKFNCFTSVFWVGVIPVAVRCNAGAVMAAEAELSASCQFESKIKLQASYNAGVYYSGGWSNKNSANASASAEFSILNPLTVTAEATAGVEIYAELKLYDCAGPKITFGPSVDATLSASLNSLKNQLEYSTEGEVNVGGKYGVEVKIWKWKLASWQKKYSVYSKSLWKESGAIGL